MWRDVAEKDHWCADRQYKQPLVSCVRCEKFAGCLGVSDADTEILKQSEFVDRRYFFTEETIKRGLRMYIGVKTNGDMVRMAADFDPADDSLDFDQLKDVEEVLQVSRRFCKQVRFVLKPLAERNAVREEKGRVAGVAPDKPKKKQAGK